MATALRNHMKRISFIVIALLLAAQPGHAQVAVVDVANSIRNAVTAVLKEHMLDLQIAQYSQLRRMAQRLSMFIHLGNFSAPEPPRWRTHPGEDGEGELITAAFQSALDFGDADGDAYGSVSEPVDDAEQLLANLPVVARRVVEQQLATIEAADAANIATVHNAGRYRYVGRAELRAIEALDRDVTDGTLEQSATAVLDKISAASLIAARQRQARGELMIGLVEQLLADTKRERDTHTAALNMQLAQWRSRQGATDAFSAGTGDALRTWRQP